MTIRPHSNATQPAGATQTVTDAGDLSVVTDPLTGSDVEVGTARDLEVFGSPPEDLPEVIGRIDVDDDIASRIRAITSAVDAGGPQLPVSAVQQARALLAKCRERTRLSGQHTVVALAGATGSGKSSLFNAISGIEIATVGVQRPTTSTVTACTWGRGGAPHLLDWLGVPQRQRIRYESPLDSGDDHLSGLVLLDLPDHDSLNVTHRLEVDRLVELVDVFVWVTDPQKYADAALHRRYLSALAGHGAVTIVVLNQADRLSQQELRACRQDLERLVHEDGLRDVRVVTTSVTQGNGVDRLRQALASAVSARAAWRQRLCADLDACADALRAGVTSTEVVMSEGNRTGRRPPPKDDPAVVLVDGLAGVVGVSTMTQDLGDAFTQDIVRVAGWPPLRWVQRWRKSPPGQLSRGRRAPAVIQRPPVELAAHRLADRAVAGLLPPWADAVRDVVQQATRSLSHALEQVIADVKKPVPQPGWVSVVGAVQWALLMLSVVGLVWSVGVAVTGLLGSSGPLGPSWGVFPVPVLMLVGGLVSGAVLGVSVRVVAAKAGRERADQLADQCADAIAAAANQHLLGPVQQVLTDHRRTREALST